MRKQRILRAHEVGVVFAFCCLLTASCGVVEEGSDAGADASVSDAGPDAGADAGVWDAGHSDGGSDDAGDGSDAGDQDDAGIDAGGEPVVVNGDPANRRSCKEVCAAETMTCNEAHQWAVFASALRSAYQAGCSTYGTCDDVPEETCYGQALVGYECGCLR